LVCQLVSFKIVWFASEGEGKDEEMLELYGTYVPRSGFGVPKY